jgi:hypothetical protein
VIWIETKVMPWCAEKLSTSLSTTQCVNAVTEIARFTKGGCEVINEWPQTNRPLSTSHLPQVNLTSILPDIHQCLFIARKSTRRPKDCLSL